MRNTLLLVFGLCVLYRLCRWLYKAYKVRSRFSDIPSLPRHWLVGNLINAGQRLNPALGRHPDYGFEEIWNELGQPGCFLADLAPIEDRGFLIIAEPQYVEALVNPLEQFKYSIPKSANYRSLRPLLGAESMISSDGETWRALRKRFNPGFQPKYIHSLSGSVVSKTNTFVERLRSAAEGKTTFRLADYAQDLTTDIITQLVLAQDFDAQSMPEGTGEKSRWGLLTASRRLSELVYAVGQGIGFHMIDPIRPVKALLYETIFDRKLTAIVRKSLASGDSLSGPKSILQLALSGRTPSEALVRNSVDQIKSFLFAGQDTTATLIQWMCYEMSKASHSADRAAIVARLREEHDTVFGPDPFSALKALSRATAESESIMNTRLPYTMAFVKETLRLHPPAATVRVVPEEATHITLKLPSREVSIAGLQVYPSLHLIQRNPNVWGPDAHEFRPDRFLDETFLAKLPPGAYRPFERGPRNCIGQELALLEALVVLVSVARGFVFEKIGLTGTATRPGGKTEKEVWSEHKVTSVPVDGMVMRVSMRGKS